jgi:hypothetical protein
MKSKVDKALVDKYFNHLSRRHVGKSKGIKRESLRALMGVELSIQKAALREINTNSEYPAIVSTSGSIYLCKTEEEVKTAAFNEIRSGLTRLNKGKKMLSKFGRRYQIKIDDIF